MFTKIKCSYVSFWRNELGDHLEDNGKLSFYRKIKSNFVFEPYLLHVKKFRYRRCVTAIRISAHKLEVEVGRYTNKNHTFIERNRRYCMLCLERENKCFLGDEIHAILYCPVFNAQRNSLFKYFEDKYVHFNLLNNIEKCIFLLSSENNDINVVSKFIDYILSYKRPKFNLNSNSCVLKFGDKFNFWHNP